MKKLVRSFLTSLIAVSLILSFNLYAPKNVFASGQVWNFGYTGSVQSFTAPYSGTYQLEVWGAQGGNGEASGTTLLGGTGGYSKGNILLYAGQTIYVFVGGSGTGGYASSNISGGYNGGGLALNGSSSGLPSDSYQLVHGSGGGATDIRTQTDSNWQDYLSSRVIVAGGGGGAGGAGIDSSSGGTWSTPGGAGGGLSGLSAPNSSDSQRIGGGGGTQSYGGSAGFYFNEGAGTATSGSFGQGGTSGVIFNNFYVGGAGGGGWYGGGGGAGGGPGGGGGSGYIGGVTNGQTIAGNQWMTSPYGGNEVGQAGNGSARITALDTPPIATVSSPTANTQYAPGTNMLLSGSIYDPDAQNGYTMSVIYSIDGGTPITGATLSDTSYAQNFSVNVSLANNLSIGNHTLNVWAMDNQGASSSEQNITFNIKDTIPPALSVTGNPTSWTNQNVTLTANASDNVSVYGIKLPDGNWVYSSSANYTVSSNGPYTFVAQDGAGNQTSQTVDVSMIDTTPPATPTIALSNASWTNALSVTATITSNGDAGGSGVKQVEYSLSGATNQGWTVYSSPLSITNEGQTTILARVLDVAGNYSSTVSQVVKIDRTNPDATITSNPSDLTNVSVTLTVNATDTESGVQRIELPDGSWVNGSTAQCTVNNNQTLTFEIEDEAGNIKAVQYTVNNIKKDVLVTNNPNVTLELSADDALSGVAEMQLKNENQNWSSWEPYVTTKDWTLDPHDGLKHVWVQYKDGAGNISFPVEDIIILDQTPPVISNLQINNGDAYTGNSNVTLSLSATDNLTDVKSLMISNDNENWTTVPYATTIPWTLANGDGNQTVYVKAVDGAGNISTASTAQIFLDTTKPTAGILIDGGATETGSRDVTLTLTFADSGSGVASVQVVEGDNTYTLPSTATSPTTLPWTLDYGTTQTVTIVVTDKVGNVATASATISVDKLQIQSFTLTNVVNPTQPFSPKVWPFVPQNMLAGANISFAINLKAPYDASVVKDSVTYKVEVTGTNYDKVIFGNMDDSGGDVFSKTVTLPNDAPTGAKVYVNAVAQRQLEVAPYDLQTVYFPGEDSTTMAQVGVIQDNVDDLIRFNETY